MRLVPRIGAPRSFDKALRKRRKRTKRMRYGPTVQQFGAADRSIAQIYSNKVNNLVEQVLKADDKVDDLINELNDNKFFSKREDIQHEYPPKNLTHTDRLWNNLPPSTKVYTKPKTTTPNLRRDSL